MVCSLSAALESRSHSARIKYSVTSIRLGCCSYRQTSVSRRGKRGDRDLNRGACLRERVRSRARRRADKYALRFNISRSRLNFKCQSGGYTSGGMFLPTRLKRKSLCRSRKRGELAPFQRTLHPVFLSSLKMRRQHPLPPTHTPNPYTSKLHPLKKKKTPV